MLDLMFKAFVITIGIGLGILTLQMTFILGLASFSILDDVLKKRRSK